MRHYAHAISFTGHIMRRQLPARWCLNVATALVSRTVNDEAGDTLWSKIQSTVRAARAENHAHKEPKHKNNKKTLQ